MNTKEIRKAASHLRLNPASIERSVNILEYAADEIDNLRGQLEGSECTCEKLRLEHQESHQEQIDEYRKHVRTKVSKRDYDFLMGDE